MSKQSFLNNLSSFQYNGKGPATYIYFIISQISPTKDYLNRVKIGVSKSPNKRCNMLQVGNPAPLHLWYAIKINEDQKFYLERQLHSKFRWSKSKHKKRTEWFTIHPYIRNFIKAHKQMIGYTRKDYERLLYI